MRTVVGEMILQVCQDYPGIPDYNAMEFSEIVFFYNGNRASMLRSTAPRKKK